MISAVPNERVHTERNRAESFGAVAEQYERFRPSYPAALVDDLAALGATDVLDVGCGTGKAGRLLVERGLLVLGVEIDGDMANIARRHGLTVEVSSFETWEAAGRQFDLIISAQAWHWVDPVVGVPKAARLLRPGGTIALFWNSSELDEGIQAALDGVYRLRAPALVRPPVDGNRSNPPYAGDLDRSGLFEPSYRREYSWQKTYHAADWVQLIQTHSDHVVLDDSTRTALIAGVADVIDAHGGSVRATYHTRAVLAHLPSP